MNQAAVICLHGASGNTLTRGRFVFLEKEEEEKREKKRVWLFQLAVFQLRLEPHFISLQSD